MARSDTTPGGMGTSSDSGSSSTSGMLGTAQETASQVAGKAQEAAAPIIDKASEKASQVMDQASEQMTSRLDSGKEYAVESLTGVAQALRQTGQHLREEGAQPTLGQFADTGAEKLERVTGYLRQRDTHQLIAEVESFARRSPTLFAGGAFALGLLAARFLRSSGERLEAASTRASTSYGQYAPTTPGGPSGHSPSSTPMSTATRPPSYTSTAPAARTFPPSHEWSPSTPGRSSTSPAGEAHDRDAEQLTPIPGSLPSVGSTTTGTGASSTGPERRTTAADAPPSSERPAPGSRPQV